MYAIAGATGHVGGHAAEELLARGEQVRVLVRSEEKGAPWSKRGAEVAVTDLADRTTLAAAIRGCRGVFVLLPAFDPKSDFHTEQRELADAIVAAVTDSEVPHVVMLSSIGAELSQGTGPLLPLHYLENRLRATGAVLSALRPFHFQEKVEEVLGAVLGPGFYPNFGVSADMAMPMTATRDIGAAVAETLVSAPETSEVVDLEGPHYTEQEVADTLSALLSRPVPVVNVPRQDWVDTIAQSGVSRHFAEVLVELHDAAERGILRSNGDRVRYCTTELAQTLRAVVPAHS